MAAFRTGMEPLDYARNKSVEKKSLLRTTRKLAGGPLQDPRMRAEFGRQPPY